MRFMFDLSTSQAARVLDQAIRHRATVLLEPRAWIGGRTVTLALQSCDERYLTAQGVSETDEVLESLVGMHMDVHLSLGETSYLFDTHVIDVEESAPGLRLLLARPETLQVAQRRRFRRKTLESSCPVHLALKRPIRTEKLTCNLLNLSPEGMACRLGEADAAMLRIGEGLRVAFHPSECEHSFEFDAVLANKSRAGSEGHSIVGLRFQSVSDNRQASEERQRLCDFLYGTSPAMALQEGE